MRVWLMRKDEANDSIFTKCTLIKKVLRCIGDELLEKRYMETLV